ncbi:hypothetical protein C4K25_0723 [Pseudomonas chlororaphis]|nr:hypothetical protein C4K25_0723 [Pseudomonas chlororaphis]
MLGRIQRLCGGVLKIDLKPFSPAKTTRQEEATLYRPRPPI